MQNYKSKLKTVNVKYQSPKFKISPNDEYQMKKLLF